MERVYENRSFLNRSNISSIVLIVVPIYGIFELWMAFSSPNGDSTAALFGVLFIGGAAYGAWSLWNDTRDLVVALDVDGEHALVTLWRPFGTRTIATDLASLTGWRHWVKVTGRGVRTHFIYANLAGQPRPLAFEMSPGKPVADGLRRIAPGAVEGFEIATGARAGGDAD